MEWLKTVCNKLILKVAEIEAKIPSTSKFI